MAAVWRCARIQAVSTTFDGDRSSSSRRQRCRPPRRGREQRNSRCPGRSESCMSWKYGLPSRPTAATLGEHRAYCSGVPVFEADIADQRSSKLAVGVFASTGKPFDVVVPSETAVEGACVLTLAAVAATASRATATNPVIVRCFVIRTSCGGPPLAWVMGILRRFNSDATIMDCANPKTDNEAVPNADRCSGRACCAHP